MKENASTNNWLKAEYIWSFSGLQLLLMGLSIVLFITTSFAWLHIFPYKNLVTNHLPFDFNQYKLGKDILGLSNLFCLVITFFAAIKPFNTFLLPLLIGGIYLFYYAYNNFLIQLESSVTHHLISKWFDYKLLVPLYLFVIIYLVLIIFSVLILLNKKK